MEKYKLKLKWILLISLLLGTAIITIFYTRYHLSKTEAFHARKANKPIPVKIWKVKKKNMDYIIGAPGVSISFKEVNISAPFNNGIVQHVYVKIGDLINKNDVLLLFNTELLQGHLKTLKAQLKLQNIILKNKKIYYLNMKDLYEKGYVSLQEVKDSYEEWKQIEVQCINTEQKIKEVLFQINHARITSPCKGIIMEKNINEGEFVGSNVNLFKIGQINPILFDAMVSEEYVDIIKPGLNGTVEFNVWPGKVFQGTVYKIEGKIETSKIFHIYISISNTDFKIKPGLSGFAKIHFIKKCIVLPNIALQKTLDRMNYVFMIDSQNRAHIREVVTGIMGPNYTEIINGIKEGDVIVTAGLKGLRDNDIVQIK